MEDMSVWMEPFRRPTALTAHSLLGTSLDILCLHKTDESFVQSIEVGFGDDVEWSA